MKDLIDRQFNKKIISVSVEMDDISCEIARTFDYEFDGELKFECWSKPNIPTKYNIGLIVGGSGTGKTMLLREFGEDRTIVWMTKKSIASHFSSVKEAIEKFSAVGLNTVPVWVKPYHVLSNGEKFRADLSRKLKNGAVIDEFTSVVDRNVAKSASHAVQKYIRKKKLKRLVFASCHYDIIDWLKPDWIFDCELGRFTNLPRGRLLRSKELIIKIYEADCSIWELFKKHHYLTRSINTRGTLCHMASVVIDDEECLFGFHATMPFPTRKGNAVRGHRMVVLPEFQGLGIGLALVEVVARYYNSIGKVFYGKTSNIKMISHLRRSKGWQEVDTYDDHVRKDAKYSDWKLDKKKIGVAKSFKYIGEENE